MGDYAKQWDRPYPRGVVDQLSGKNPYTAHYGVSGSTGGGYNADLVDERTRAAVSRLDERIVAEQTMRLECLKVAASMQVSPANLLDTAESLLKWVRGN